MRRKYKIFRFGLTLLVVCITSTGLGLGSIAASALSGGCDQEVCILTCKDGTTIFYDKAHDPLTTDQECASHGGAKSWANECSDGSACTPAPSPTATPLMTEKAVGNAVGPGLSGIDVSSLPGAGGNNANTNTLQKILQITFGIAGAIALLVITIGGFNYITSAGDPQKAANARNAIIYALVGLVIAIFAETLIGFVVGHV